MARIFISHKKEDASRAVEIERFISSNGVACWVDVLDPALAIPIDITRYITGKLRDCTHILAVYSKRTKESMWVPFELGAAYEADKGIGTYLYDDISHASLPVYLRSFPSMTSNFGLAIFVEEAAKETIERKAITLSETASTAAPYADRFIRAVKSRLYQS